MADKKEKDEILKATPEVETTIREPKKVKVKVLANIKYGEAIHTIGEKIYILATEVKEFEALNLVKKVVFEKEENDSAEVGE